MTTSNDTPEVEYKQCTKCGEWKPATPEYFKFEKRNKDGFKGICADCDRKYARDYATRKRRKNGILPSPVIRNGNKRKCGHCDEWKVLNDDNFSPSKKSPDGYAYECKECVRKRALKRRRENGINSRQPQGSNSPHINGKKQCRDCGEWKLATKEYFYRAQKNWDGLDIHCSECRRTQKQKDYAQNPNKYKQWRISWRKKNSEKVKLIKQKYYLENRQEILQKRKVYNLQNHEVIIERARIWRRRNPEKRRATIHRYLANKNHLPAYFNDMDWVRCVSYFGGRCAVCERQMDNLFGDMRAEADHWIPLSSDDCPGTVPENIVCLCGGRTGCNQSKGGKDPEVWLIETYGQRKAKQILDRIHAYFEWVKDQTD